MVIKGLKTTKWSDLIPEDHTFSIVSTDGRDAQQKENYPIKDSELLLRLVEAGMRVGFGQETNGGDLSSTMIKNNQNPIEHQDRVNQKAKEHGVETEFLLRNANAVGYQPLSRNDLEYTLKEFAPNFTRARNFSHSNFLPTLLAAGEITDGMGLQTQFEFTPSYNAEKLNNGKHELKPVFTDGQVIEYFQTIAALGFKRGGFKIADGVMPPEDLFRITSKLKQPGVLPEDFVLVCHTHDTNKIGREQYEAFLAAGGNVIHCSHPAFADGFGQPSVDHFVKMFGPQIEGFRPENYQSYIDEGNKIAVEGKFKNTNLDELLYNHSKVFISRLYNKHNDIYEKKFPDMSPAQAIQSHKELLVELIHASGVPGGGVKNAIDRAEKVGWHGLKTIPQFSNRDFLEEYLITLIDIKPKLGGNQYVTPNYKNADETACAIVANPEVKDPFVRRSYGENERPEFLPARRILQGEYDPPQGKLDKAWLSNVKEQELLYLMRELRAANLIGDNAFETFTGQKLQGDSLKNPDARKALLEASEAINALYRTTREREILEKQATALERLSNTTDDTFYKVRQQVIEERLSKTAELDSVSLEEYKSLMNKGKSGARLVGKVKDIVESNPLLKQINEAWPDTLGMALRAVTFLECSAVEILPDRQKEVEIEVARLRTIKGADKRNALFPESNSVALGLMVNELDPASPKLGQCIAQDLARKSISKLRRSGGVPIVSAQAELTR